MQTNAPALSNAASLRNLPEEQQCELIELLQRKTPAQARAWLRRKGIDATQQALNEFVSWRQLREQFAAWENDTRTMLELLRTQHPELAEHDLERYGHALFQLQAIKLQDVNAFTRLVASRQRAEMEEKKLELRQEQFRLQREKFEFDAAEACLKKLPELKEISADDKLEFNAKINAIRLKLFGVIAE